MIFGPDLVLCVHPSFPDGFQKSGSLLTWTAQNRGIPSNVFFSVSGLTVDSFIASSLPPTARGKLRPGDGLYSIGGVVVY